MTKDQIITEIQGKTLGKRFKKLQKSTFAKVRNSGCPRMELVETANSDTVSPKQNPKYCKKKGRIQTEFTKTNSNLSVAMPDSKRKAEDFWWVASL